MTAALVSGALLGLSCGLAPGPLMALVLSQAMRHGAREGCKVAFTPLFTDAPGIILLTLLLAARLAEARPLLGVVSLAGGVFVLHLAWQEGKPMPSHAAVAAASSASWRKGILTNLLSPHPWLFWMTVGAATLARAIAQSWLAGVVFLGGFYVLLVGSKLLVAFLASRAGQWLSGRAFRAVMRALALLLGVFALMLFRQAWMLLAA